MHCRVRLGTDLPVLRHDRRDSVSAATDPTTPDVHAKTCVRLYGTNRSKSKHLPQLGMTAR
jgi:hypothetical protein